MNKYFENISTLEELRKLYKELLKLHHPDNASVKFTCQTSKYSFYMTALCLNLLICNNYALQKK
uniref:J domain-containing protein n=1 Tax=Eubacterium plexicaudatum ASF492 TaxID=1235802 RepID=N2ANW7_9FIRM